LAEAIRNAPRNDAALEDVRTYFSLLDILLGVSTPFDSWLAYSRAQTLSKVQEVLDRFISSPDRESARWAAKQAVQLEPHNEAAVRFLMRDLWQSGAANRAITIYNELYAHLDEAFDQEPEAETIDLLAAITLDPEGLHSNMGGGPTKPRITLEVVEADTPAKNDHDASLQAVLVSDLRMRLGRFREWEIQLEASNAPAFLSIKCTLHSIGDARYQQTMRFLTDLSQEAETAIDRATNDLNDLQSQQAVMLASAPRWQDEQRLFRDKDGNVRAQTGEIIEGLAAEDVVWLENASTYEEWRMLASRIIAAQNLLDSWQDLRDNHIAPAQEEITDEDDPVSMERMSEIKDELTARADALRQQQDRDFDQDRVASAPPSNLAKPSL
jgi:hypothetical protein